MKKLLITGINGFIGSYCSAYFSDKGYEVFGIDVLGTKKDKFMLAEVNVENLKKFNTKFDVIIHLAGAGTVKAAQSFPEEERIKTVGSAKHVLDYVKNFNQDAKIIYSSSAAVYGNEHADFITENSQLKPISVYGQHKLEVEILLKEYSYEYGIDVGIIRFFSVYGEGLKKQIFWDFCNRLKNNFDKSEITCFGTGNEKRDYIHISDAIELIENVVNSSGKFVVVNGGTAIATKISDLLNDLKKVQNYQGKLVYDNIEQEGNPISIVADIKEAEKLGFSPKVKLNQGIRKYVKWFNGNC